MLAYAVFVTFLLGMLFGSVLTILIALHMAAKDKEIARRKTIHPSTRVGPNPFQADILEYKN